MSADADYELELCDDSDNDTMPTVVNKPADKKAIVEVLAGKSRSKKTSKYDETYNEDEAAARAKCGIFSKMIGYDSDGDKIFTTMSIEEQSKSLAEKVKVLQKKKNELKRNLPDKLRERNAKLQAEIAELRNLAVSPVEKTPVQPKQRKTFNPIESIDEEQMPEVKSAEKKLNKPSVKLASKFIQRR